MNTSESSDARLELVTRPHLAIHVTQEDAQVHRIGGLELLRLVSVIGVVWFHTHAPGWSIAYAGLPALLIMSLALQCLHGRERRLAEVALRRAKRLLVPWLFWSMIYGAVALRAVFHQHGRLADSFSVNMLIMGPAVHLWFLPFAFLATLLVYLLAKCSRTWSLSQVMLVGATMLVLLVLARHSFRWLCPNTSLLEPIPQWQFGMFSLPLGWVIGHVVAQSCRDVHGRYLLAATCAIVLVLLPFAAWLSPHDGIAYAIAVPLVCGAFLWTRPLWSPLQTLTSASFGVYLLHPLVSMALYPWIGPTGLMRPVAVLAVSFLLTCLLRFLPVKNLL